MAVYTHLSDEEIRKFLTEYDIGQLLNFSEIAEGVENSNFLLTTSSNKYILTLYEKRVDPHDLPFFLKLLSHLASSGLSCPLPVEARDGKALRTLGGKPAAIVTYLQGSWPRQTTLDQCKALGSTMAMMHEFGKSFQGIRKNALTLTAWRPLLDSCRLPEREVYINLFNELNQELKWLEANWPKSLPSGIIHADLFPDNVFFKDDNLSGVIDFYFACNDFLAYDIAVCINAWCFDENELFNFKKSSCILSAYNEMRTLSKDEMASLPVLIRGSAIRFLLTRLYDWLNHPEDALVKPKDPMSYLKKLRFHQQVSDPSGYGAEI
tara:strand:- start:74 stop:1039 length:966 start_codon:yes stop_codon:yes gene_type:complete